MLDISEIKKQVDESRVCSDSFENGFKSGEEHAKKEIKKNKMLETLLLEFIGYEDEWLTSKPGYKKYNKDELIEIILKQRALMNTLFTNVEDSKKEELKIKIEKTFWPIMHQD